METDSYRGEHEAPCPESGAPLYNVTKIYPDDIYTLDYQTAARYYGMGEQSMDVNSILIIKHAKDKPALPVKIYRAIPKIISTQDKINDILQQKAYILKHGKPPKDANTNLNSSAYYDKLDAELKRLQALPPQEERTLSINKGDWVTINREYAVYHGKTTLLGKYRILSKTVPARTLYTSGDNIHEWGYYP